MGFDIVYYIIIMLNALKNMANCIKFKLIKN